MVLSGYQRAWPGQGTAKACCYEMLKHIAEVILDFLSDHVIIDAQLCLHHQLCNKAGKGILTPVCQLECSRRPLHAEGSSGDPSPVFNASSAVQEDFHFIAVLYYSDVGWY